MLMLVEQQGIHGLERGRGCKMGRHEEATQHMAAPIENTRALTPRSSTPAPAVLRSDLTYPSVNMRIQSKPPLRARSGADRLWCYMGACTRPNRGAKRARHHDHSARP